MPSPMGSASKLRASRRPAGRTFTTRSSARHGSTAAHRGPAGLGWDTRDSEMEPTRGGLVEATARVTAPLLGSRYVSGGAFASAAVYQAIATRVVIAGRVALDETWGDVPFDRLGDFGSLLTPF